jgi:hypothetical protein
VKIGEQLVEAHHAVRDLLREHTSAKVGWTVTNRACVARGLGGRMDPTGRVGSARTPDALCCRKPS